MENVKTMSDLMQQIQQRIDSLKASAMQQQTEMKQSLNECIEQSAVSYTHLPCSIAIVAANDLLC